MSRRRVGQEAFEYADDRTLTVVDRAAGATQPGYRWIIQGDSAVNLIGPVGLETG